MAATGDNRDPVENAIVCADLRWKSDKLVDVALNFKSVNLPVYDRDIDASQAGQNAHFRNHEGIGF